MSGRAGRVGWAAIALVLFCAPMVPATARPKPGPAGTLANHGFVGQPIKSVFFFAGSWRHYPGTQYYEHPSVSNHCLYTEFPVDPRHLGWSENAENRRFALEQMTNAGVNVVNMSYWGKPGDDRWAFWAPMQTSTRAHDELFDAAHSEGLLIAPYIEGGAPTQGQLSTGCHGEQGIVGTSPGYEFADDFPGTRQAPAPGLVSQIKDLISRYLVAPRKGAWKHRWARVYDQNGAERYAISIIHAASNQLCPLRVACAPADDRTFAEGFGWVADKVYADTGVRVGFLLDAMPPQARFVYNFVPSPATTGAALTQQPSVLAIQPFIPEIGSGLCPPDADCDAPAGSAALRLLVEWKRAFARSWIDTGIPYLFDASPGYDGHRVFPDSPLWGNNEMWRDGQSEMLGSLAASGITLNTWNGFTEGFAAMPVCRIPDGPPSLPECPAADGADATYRWFASLSLP